MTTLGSLTSRKNTGMGPAKADRSHSRTVCRVRFTVQRSSHILCAEAGEAGNRTLQISNAIFPSPSLAVPVRKISMTATIHARAVSDEEAKAQLKGQFSGWNIIRSADGRWWAQLFPVPPELFNEPNMVDADTAAGLHAKLAKLVKP